MGANANNQTHRGRDVKIRLYENAVALDIIEAEKIDLNFELNVIEAEVLSVGHTTRDTHIDGLKVDITGVKKGNALVDKMLEMAKQNRKTGKALPKFKALIKYKDPTTGTTKNVTIIDANMTEFAGITSGGIKEKATEGFSLIGQAD